MALFCAAELMRRVVKSRTPTLLQRVIGDHLSLHKVPRKVKSFMSKVRVAASETYTSLKKVEHVNEKILQRWDLAVFVFGLLLIQYAAV